MLIVARILILSFYVAGLSLVAPVNAQSSANQVTVSHTHVISDHHHKQDHNSGDYGHHHHHHDESAPDDGSNSDETSNNGEPVDHSHSFTICAAPSYCVNFAGLNIVPLPEGEARLPGFLKKNPPKDLSLDGIFRPPIA